ncbi:MAG: 4Fe-4S dicluster domain-containing protein [Eubacteriales bacterium]|nr:4Fe-4S dicluster domain-containing protein [Eubacteriales bacterium]
MDLDKVKVFVYARAALKNLVSKPATVDYPAKPAEFPERMRGHIEISPWNCIGCGMCMRSCPPGAIRVDRAADTWSIERFDCVQCGSCVNVCPKKCLSLVSGYTAPGEKKRLETVMIPAKKVPPRPAAKPQDV